jgi:cell division septum initiation protein DivIVA
MTISRSDVQDLTKKAAGAAESGLEHARTFGETAQATAQSFADQAHRVAGAAGDTAQHLGRQATDTVQHLTEHAGEIAGQAREIAGEAYRRGERAAEYVGGRIEQQPLASILLAFGVGYAISYLVHSRRSV